MLGWRRRRPPGPSLTLGHTTPAGFVHTPFVLDAPALSQHKHVMGVTGSGKTNCLALLFLELLQQGIGAALIDPHGDVSREILRHLSDRGYFQRPDAFERLWYIKFKRTDRYLPFNVLKQARVDAYTIANQFVEVCTRVWSGLSDGAAPQFENVMTAAVITLVYNGLALTDIEPLLTSKVWRERLLQQVPDPRIAAYFHNRYDQWGRDAQAMIESTLRREFLFTIHPALRNTLGQRDNTLQFRECLDSGRSLICNLGGLDRKVKRYLGAFLTVGFEEAAFSREDIIDETARPWYHLLIDEFPLFSATSEEGFIDILSEARKYRLPLTLAHQNWSQVSARLKGGLQNCIDLMFQLGDDDAQWAARRFARFDPYRIKHEVADDAKVDQTHPLYVSMQEQYAGMAETLTTLAPGEAYVRIGSLRQRVQTHYLGKPRTSYEDLERLEDTYAQLLQVPVADIEAAVQPAEHSGTPAEPAEFEPLPGAGEEVTA